MTDPGRKEMKHLKAMYDMLGYVADAQHGIPTECPCGGSIVEKVCGEEVFDTMPGKKFFVCSNYKDNGLHFKQPWVLGVEEEIGKLVEKAENMTSKLQDIKLENAKLKADVVELTGRVILLEKLCFEADDSGGSS